MAVALALAFELDLRPLVFFRATSSAWARMLSRAIDDMTPMSAPTISSHTVTERPVPNRHAGQPPLVVALFSALIVTWRVVDADGLSG